MRCSIACLLALAACAPTVQPSASTGGNNTQVVSSTQSLNVSTESEFRVVSASVGAPVARVLEVLPAVYQELGLTPAAEPAVRTVRAQGAMARRFQGQATSSYFDCGRGQFGVEIATQYEVRFNLQTTVQPGSSPESSRLDSGVEAYARNNDGSANALLAVCHTRGKLEELIAARIREKLGA
jgi:hypothetical protein